VKARIVVPAGNAAKGPILKGFLTVNKSLITFNMLFWPAAAVLHKTFNAEPGKKQSGCGSLRGSRERQNE